MPGHVGLDQTRRQFYASIMPADLNIPTQDAEPETFSEREKRIQWEAAVIAQARAEIAAGQYINGDDLDAWFEALEHDPDAPLPEPRAGQAGLPLK